jgi:hypothetical protein
MYANKGNWLAKYGRQIWDNPVCFDHPWDIAVQALAKPAPDGTLVRAAMELAEAYGDLVDRQEAAKCLD